MSTSFKGDSVVFVGSEGERDPFGVQVTTYSFEGVASAMAALAASQPLGIKVGTHQRGAVVGVDLTYSPDAFFDRWETDKENIDKDLLYNIAFNILTLAEKNEVRRWRGDPTSTLNVNIDPAGNHTVLLGQIQDLVLAGTEAYQVSTLILKRTRKLSVNLAPTITLSEQTVFYSTAQMLSVFDCPITNILPVNPYPPPANHAWGWLPRQANRSYIAKGIMEEHSDWVFAAWSTVLYSQA